MRIKSLAVGTLSAVGAVGAQPVLAAPVERDIVPACEAVTGEIRVTVTIPISLVAGGQALGVSLR